MKSIKSTLFLLTAIIASCSEGQNPSTSNNQQKQISSDNYRSSQGFLSHFKEISFDSLWVYPDSMGNAPDYKFRGKPLLPEYYYLFNEIIINAEGIKDSVLTTSYRFTINKSLIGLLCEMTGLDGSFTSINLFIWNKEKKKITHSFNLADKIGDAGGGYEFNSIIYNKGSGLFEIIKRETNYQPNERADDEELTFNYKHSTSYWKITDSEISKIQ